ncbi:MAG: DUF2752 domain-containing protein [Akkermansia sp.]|nr:DUF2752 domain-containing protein [Akkermansia sp.]
MSRTARGLLLLLPPLLAVVVMAVECAYPGWLSHAVEMVSPGCIFRRLTGLSCPGCGGTRAARALLAGDVWAACRLNFFLVPSVLMLLAEYVREAAAFIRRRPVHPGRTYIRIVQLYAGLAIAWFILRNVFGV